MTEPRPTVAAGMLRGYLAVLESRGLLPPVRDAVSERARKVIDDPPLPISWIDTALVEEIMDAVGRVHGRETVREVGRETARTKLGSILVPFMRTLLALWGATPHSIFKQVQRLAGVISKGLQLSYVPETPTSGTVELFYPAGTNDSVFASWEGSFHLAFDVCNVEGTIGRAEVSDDGRRARIAVRWSQR
ncbi:MAG TPA: hypothetical protein VFA20_31875 [Myxococcaceae bacterium]|nr:hypothetical protein [Myxococcaceae bacterium]